MKFTLLLFSFFLFQAISWSQSDTLNRTNDEGKKQGYWVYYGKDKPETGIPENGIYREGTYLNDRKVGLWKVYHNDGVHVKLQGHYVNNRPFGGYKKFWSLGTLKEEGTFKNNKFINARKMYFPSGVMSSNQYYDSIGKLTDTAFHYFETGCLQRVKIHRESTNQIETKMYYRDSCNVVRKASSAPMYENTDVVWGAKDTKRRNLVKSNHSLNSIENPTESWRNDPKWNNGHYNDESLCSDQKGTIRKKNERGEYIFTGICKDGKIWSGKMFFYDSDNVLLRVENWKDGTFINFGAEDK